MNARLRVPILSHNVLHKYLQTNMSACLCVYALCMYHTQNIDQAPICMCINARVRAHTQRGERGERGGGEGGGERAREERVELNSY